jgi:hypothetical protein
MSAPLGWTGRAETRTKFRELSRIIFRALPQRVRARDVHTNTAKGVFSIFKREMKGIYQHCSEKHLHRYLAEYELRYNHRVALEHNDIDRTLAAVRASEGKRLTYKQPREAKIPF